MRHPHYTVVSKYSSIKDKIFVDLKIDERTGNWNLNLDIQSKYNVWNSVSSLCHVFNYYGIQWTQDKSIEIFLTVKEFYEYQKRKPEVLSLTQSFLTSYLNVGFWRGEKKSGVTQMLVLRSNLSIHMNKILDLI